MEGCLNAECPGGIDAPGATTAWANSRPYVMIRGGSRGCPGCLDTRPLLRVPFLASYLKIYCGPIWRNIHFPVLVDYRNSIAGKIDATHAIKAHSIIQFVMPGNARKSVRECLDFQILWGRPPDPLPALRPSDAPF